MHSLDYQQCGFFGNLSPRSPVLKAPSSGTYFHSLAACDPRRPRANGDRTTF